MCRPFPKDAEITLLLRRRVVFLRGSGWGSSFMTTDGGSACGCSISSSLSKAMKTSRTIPASLLSSKAPLVSSTRSFETVHLCWAASLGKTSSSLPMLRASNTRTSITVVKTRTRLIKRISDIFFLAYLTRFIRIHGKYELIYNKTVIIKLYTTNIYFKNIEIENYFVRNGSINQLFSNGRNYTVSSLYLYFCFLFLFLCSSLVTYYY